MQIPETEIIVTKEGKELLRKTVRPGDYVIGREPGCDLYVDSDDVSRRHAQLTVNYDHALIEDLGSTHGTFVNGHRISDSTRLWPNQKIQIGKAVVELHRLKTVPPPGESLAPQTAAVRRLLPEQFLNEQKYDIGQVVAHGGMGAILDAREATIERRVAMKVMLDGASPDDVTRFVAEAKITGQLEHPNVVPVHELDVDENGQPFYTMKMVRGVTLRKVLDLLADGTPDAIRKYPLAALLTTFQKVCDAIAFAHSNGVLHRDLKPENIMLDDFGVVLVMDWGLAKIIGQKESSTDDVTRSAVHTVPSADSGSGTIAGTVMGTPQYMSPEQARGEIETLDARSDIYALGAILYHILALRPSVNGANAWAIVSKVAQGEIEPLLAVPAINPSTLPHLPGGHIPDGLVAVVRQAMSFDRAHRYATVADLQRDIEAYQNGRATRAENAGLGKQLVLLVKRHKALFGTVFAAWLIITVLAAWFIVSLHASERRASAQRDRAEREKARAEKNFDDLRRTAPDLLALAASEASLQHFDSALTKIATVIALDPALTAAYWRRGWILLAQEKIPEALEALRFAQGKDPANQKFAELIPLVQNMATAPTEERHSPKIVRPIYTHLASIGAEGESTPFIRYIKQTAAQDLQLVQQRVEKWLGRPKPGEKASFILKLSFGTKVDLNINGIRVGNLEPLRGLPVDELIAEGCQIESLGPLQGMHLVRLFAGMNPIQDLDSLRGMPLEELNINATPIRDLSPLSGMKLKSLYIVTTQVRDLSPLAGMPLQLLHVAGCQVADFSPIRGLPLHWLDVGGTQFSDANLLRGMPLESLTASSTRLSDVSGLAGLPLKDLRLSNLASAVTHLESLLQVPTLERLSVDCGFRTLLLLRDHPGLKEIDWQSRGYRPVAEIWAEYDASRNKIIAALQKMGVSEGVEERVKVNDDLSFSVNIRGQPVSDLTSLTRLPISRLDAGATKIGDITPLSGMALQGLNLSGCPVSDLSPLRGMKLTDLGLGATKVTDLSVLRGMPLTAISLDNTDNLDLSPLSNCLTLKIAILPLHVRHLEVLRKLPNLKQMSWGRPGDGDTLPSADTFWKDYDAQQAAKK